MPVKRIGRKSRIVLATCALIVIACWIAIPHIGAGLILHPFRKPLAGKLPPPRCEAVVYDGAGVKIHGWKGSAVGKPRGTVIYLHGVSDNRASGAGVMERFQKRGFDVIAYDSRAHGESGGEFCTYGFYEKEDLRKVIDTISNSPVILIGSSLGAAVSLQLAASDPRVHAVVAAETFSDIRIVATERAPIFFTSSQTNKAFSIAENKASFRMDSASPAEAASRIHVPVLLIHGAKDIDTPPAHSQRVLARLAGPKDLILVPGAGHNQSLSSDVWPKIEAWIDQRVAGH